VLQRRTDSVMNFNRTWRAYREGFGDIEENFWIG